MKAMAMSHTQVNNRLLELLNDLLKQFERFAERLRTNCESTGPAPNKEAVGSVADYLQEFGFSGDAQRLRNEFDNLTFDVGNWLSRELSDYGEELGHPPVSGSNAPAAALKMITAVTATRIAQHLKSLIPCVQMPVTTPDAVGGHQESKETAIEAQVVNDKDDTKDDTQKNSGNSQKTRRLMTTKAADCVRIYKSAQRSNIPKSMNSVVSDYVEENGGSKTGLMRRLNDNTDQWKDLP